MNMMTLLVQHELVWSVCERERASSTTTIDGPDATRR